MPNRPPQSSQTPDAAVALPLFGLFLLMPPIITLFAVDRAIAGIPLIVLYLFGVWAALIACAAWLARRLDPQHPDPAPAAPEAEAESDWR